MTHVQDTRQNMEFTGSSAICSVYNYSRFRLPENAGAATFGFVAAKNDFLVADNQWPSCLDGCFCQRD